MKQYQKVSPSGIRCILLFSASIAILWAAGCDAVSKRTPPQNHQSKGVPTMDQTQTAAPTAISIPPIDEAEPKQLATATFATG
jgi:hypothetical protein